MDDGLKVIEPRDVEAAEAMIRVASQPIPEGYTMACVGFSAIGGALLVVSGPGVPAMAFHPPLTPEGKGEWLRVVRQQVQS
jgi:hypothetical protein